MPDCLTLAADGDVGGIRVRADDALAETIRRSLGPGLTTGAADDDPSGDPNHQRLSRLADRCLKALGWLATALMTVAVVLLLVSTLI